MIKTVYQRYQRWRLNSGLALPVVLVLALVASVAVQTVVALVVVLVVQTVVALVVVLVVRIVAVLPVVVALARLLLAALAVDCRCTLCLPVWHFPSAI